MVEFYPTSSTSSRETISCLRHSFAIFGLPVTIVSDNATEFQSFVTATGVKHVTSAPESLSPFYEWVGGTHGTDLLETAASV